MFPTRRPATLAVAVALIAGLTVTPGTANAAPDRAAKTDFTLTVLHGNDFESQLLGVDGDTDGDGTIGEDEVNAYGSASRTVTMFDQLRKEARKARKGDGPGEGKKRGVLSVSGGDNFLGGPEFAASMEKGVPFYDSLAVRNMDLDTSAIGNHEFDFGPDTLADFIEGFEGDPPFISTNLDFSKEPRLDALVDSRDIRRSRIIFTGGTRVGVIGITTPELPTISSPRDVVVQTEIAKLVNRKAAYFTKLGIDKIVLVSHLQDIDNELALVPSLRNVDAVIGAGGGEILADEGDALVPGDQAERGYPLWADDATGARVPVATTTGDYKYVGNLVLGFDKSGRLTGADDDASKPVRVSGVGDDAVAQDPETLAQVEKPVGEYVASLAETVVANTDVPLDGVRNNVRSRETNLGDLLADALRWTGAEQAEEYGVVEPVVGIQNAGGIRNDSVIQTGPVTALNTYEVAPFANFVSVIPEVPRDTFRQLLERGVAASPEAAGPFIQISGAKFTYDTSQQAQVVNETTGEITTPGARVQRVELDDGTVVVDGGEVVDGAAISVATNDFSARGGDAYPLAGLDFVPVGKTYQQALQEYLTTGLSGQVTAADYPEGGEGRITAVG
ncbi:MAG: bifunctional metallophosphatase/5'-nucleotidase [Streptosporangiales bacterium]|nr:bifunctional metallophosphatase/5'-nucleotidase [Streptosporangiales bacterium]